MRRNSIPIWQLGRIQAKQQRLIHIYLAVCRRPPTMQNPTCQLVLAILANTERLFFQTALKPPTTHSLYIQAFVTVGLG
jgi:hypothetical protein